VKPEPHLGATSPRRHLFVYGSLVEPGCLEAVIGHPHAGERLAAQLANYQRIQSPAYAYPYVVPAPGAWVDGVLLMDLSPCDMQALDRYEEVESGTYRREAVEVDVWGCGPRPTRLRADVYAAGHHLLASIAR